MTEALPESGKKLRANVKPSPYRIPEAPPMGWSPGPSKRREWVSRGMVGVILLLQAALTLRLRNSPFGGEIHTLAEYRTGDYVAGSPSIYPKLVDALGIGGARWLSLLAMLACTAMVYSWSRRLFNERVGLAAAFCFAVIAPTLVLGALATVDALGLALLALATWLTVESRQGPPWPVFLAAPVAAMAVFVNYSALYYLPVVALLALLVSVRVGSPVRAAARTAPLVLATLGMAAYTASATTGLKMPDTEDIGTLAEGSLHWLGLLTVFAVTGAGFYLKRARMDEIPVHGFEHTAPGAGWRVALGMILCLPSFLAPVFLSLTPATAPLWRPPLAYAAMFAATMAGVGLVRIVGRHFRFPQIGIMAAVALLSIGMAQSAYEYTLWPDASRLASVLSTQVTPTGRYLASDPEPITYELKDKTKPSQWTGTSAVTGDIGKALKKQSFEIVVIERPFRTPADRALEEALRDSGTYRVLVAVPFRLGWTRGSHEIWIANDVSVKQ
ncbi:glycosyltransferase family 39 protein [Actinocorallia lasiicapitis]